jgi:hypothetical protein
MPEAATFMTAPKGLLYFVVQNGKVLCVPEPVYLPRKTLIQLTRFTWLLNQDD